MRLPLENKMGLTFLQAGAHDGITNDWLFELTRPNQWEGLCLEPQENAFLKLRANYADYPKVALLCAALGPTSGTAPFFRLKHPDPEFQRCCDPIASFHREVLLKNASIEMNKFPCLVSAGQRPNDFVTETPVTTVTWEDAMAHLPHAPDLVALDVEGAESDLLELFPWQRHRPAYVFFEAFHLPKDAKTRLMELLLDLGYGMEGVAEYGIEEFNVLATHRQA